MQGSMETRSRTGLSPRSYEDFEPSVEWVREERFETLLVRLPGFKREQVKVQIDSYRNLSTSGERPLDGNRWSRFRHVLRIADNLNISEIRAKFDNGVLYVILPKLITQVEPQDLPVQLREALTFKKPATESEPKGVVQQKTSPKFNAAEPTSQKDEIGAGVVQQKTSPKFNAREPTSQKDDIGAKQETPAKRELAKSEPKGVEQQKTSPKDYVYAQEPTSQKNEIRAKEETPVKRELAKDESKEAEDTEKVKGGAWSDDGEEERPVVEEKVSPGRGGGRGGRAAAKWAGKAWNGAGGLVMGLGKPRQLVLNVVAAIVVLVAMGTYLTYKVKKARGGEGMTHLIW